MAPITTSAREALASPNLLPDRAEDGRGTLASGRQRSRTRWLHQDVAGRGGCRTVTAGNVTGPQEPHSPNVGGRTVEILRLNETCDVFVRWSDYPLGLREQRRGAVRASESFTMATHLCLRRQRDPLRGTNLYGRHVRGCKQVARQSGNRRSPIVSTSRAADRELSRPSHRVAMPSRSCAHHRTLG